MARTGRVSKKEALLIAYEKGYRIINNEIVNPKGLKLKGYVSETYKYFGVRVGSSVYNIKVHRLLAYQKYGSKIFEKDIVVRHLNSDPLCNYDWNIGIGTQHNNMMDQPESVRIKKALIATSYTKVHNHKEILADRAAGMTYKELMLKYSISSKGTLSFICNKSYDLK